MGDSFDGRRSLWWPSLLCSAIVSTTAIVGGSVPARAAEPIGEAKTYKTVEGRELRLYVVRLDGWKPSDHRPAIVFFHGGGWVGGEPSQFNEQSRYLADRGMLCVQAEYRLLDRNGTEPPLACVQDARSAVRWVRSHAGELGVDPNRIAAGGGSAGGHLAAFVGMVDGLDDPDDDRNVPAKPNALVLFNPVFDNGPDGGYGFERVGRRYREFSPAHNISRDDPPAIIFLGTNDRLIPVDVVERFKANMTRTRVRCEAVYAEGQAHGFFNQEPWRTRTLRDAERFLRSLGWLQGPNEGRADTKGAPARTRTDPTTEERFPEAQVLAGRGLTRSGKFYVVAAEQEFAGAWGKVRPLIGSMQAAWDNWNAALQADAQVRELDGTRSELAAQIKNIRSQMGNRDRLVRRWHQADLDAAQLQLNGVKAQLDDAKNSQVSPAKLRSLQAEFLNRKEEFMEAAGELEIVYKKLRAEYDAMRKDDEIRDALRVLREKKKVNVSLGPSDNVLNAVRQVAQVRKMMSPNPDAAPGPKKRPRLKERSRRTNGPPASNEDREP